MRHFTPKDHINPIVTNMPPSGIRKLFDVAAEMKNVISLGIGEPDFITPWHIREAGIIALEKGYTQYSSNAGMSELRLEVSHYMKRRFSLDYDGLKQIIITVGGSEAIDLCMRALIKPGDEVLIPEPSFVCYSPIASLAGAVVVPIVTKAEDQFRLTAQQVIDAITPRTKLLILPFPNNPTGAIMARKDLEAIADVIRDTDICVLSDEIYAELNYSEERHVSFAEIDGMFERTIVISGFSKSYAMTGWRLGFVCGQVDFIAAMLKIHQYSIMCSPTTSQHAAIQALRHGDADIQAMKTEYNYRRRLIVDGFNKMGLSCFEPLGAFYCFPSIQSTGMDSETFCERLLYEEQVAIVPGSAFGASGNGFVRCSYASSSENISIALERISHFVKANTL